MLSPNALAGETEESIMELVSVIKEFIEFVKNSEQAQNELLEKGLEAYKASKGHPLYDYINSKRDRELKRLESEAEEAAVNFHDRLCEQDDYQEEKKTSHSSGGYMSAGHIKEIMKLNLQIERITNGQVKSINYSDLETESCIRFMIEPNDGLWKGGSWNFKVVFPENYPHCPPQVMCESDDLLHPHINASCGEICFNLLNSEWSSECRIVDIIMGMLFLFYQVDWDDALTEHFYEFNDSEIGCFDEEGARRKIVKQIERTKELNLPIILEKVVWQQPEGSQYPLKIGSAKALGLVDSSFTAMCWVKNKSLTTGNKYHKPIFMGYVHPWDKGQKLNEQSQLFQCEIRSENRYYFGFSKDDSPSDRMCRLNQWDHVAFVYDKQHETKSIIVNGENAGTRQGCGANPYKGDETIWLGSSQNTEWGCWAGLLENALIFNTALNPEQVVKVAAHTKPTEYEAEYEAANAQPEEEEVKQTNEESKGPSVILEEEIDPEYEPTEEELLEFAIWIGMDPEADREFFYIAREGLTVPLPEPWKPCKSAEGEIFYFNFDTGESVWEHPCDKQTRQRFEQAKDEKYGMCDCEE